MIKNETTMQQLADARNRDENALRLWEKRNKEWERIARRTAEKVGKPDPADTLHGSTHRWREKIEELDLIDASVPQVARGSNFWEMSLRGGAGGVRYVRFGSTFPYALYCPVRNRDMLSAEHNTFMRVMTHGGARDHKSGATLGGSEYWQTKHKEYRRFIAKRFPHKMHDQVPAPLIVEGGPPPVTDEPPPEDAGTAPVQHYEIDEELPTEDAPPPPPAAEAAEAADAAAEGSAEASADAGGLSVQPDTGLHDGPLLVVATSRLLFHTAPSELGQSSLRVNNMGSTAIFYDWSRLATEPIKDRHGNPLPTAGAGGAAAPFVLSDAMSGVMLPGDEHYFTFAFRHPSPCVLAEDWELHTRPAAAERIIIQLRGTVTAREPDPVHVQYMSRHLEEKFREEMAAGFFTELLNRGPLENVFDLSEQQAEGRRKEEEAARAREEEAARKARAERDFSRENESALRRDAADQRWKPREEFAGAEEWAAADAGLRLCYDEVLYDKLRRLHGTAHELSLLLTGAEPTAPPQWSGSAEHIVEMLQGLPDTRCRRELLLCHDSLLAAARHDHARPGGAGQLTPWLQERWQGLLRERGAESAQQRASLLLLHACCHRALWSAAAEELHERSVSLQEQLGLCTPRARGGGAKGKGGGKAPAKGKAGKTDEETLSPEKMKEQYSEQLHSEISGMLWDAIDQTFTLWEQQTQRLDMIVDGSPAEVFSAEIAAKAKEREPPPPAEAEAPAA